MRPVIVWPSYSDASPKRLAIRRDCAASSPIVSKLASENPYYMEIADDLRQRLLSGDFKPGQRFYSVRGLITETRRSLPTVRSALNILIKDGLLEARQGSGIYVTDLVTSASRSKREFHNFMAVIPSTSEPDEPWFTGKVGLGMINRANRDHSVVSFYKRRTPGDRSPALVQQDLESVLAMNPDGIAWLHPRDEDTEILSELHRRRIPVVTTMRKIPGLDLPLIQEDNLVYASMVLANFQARGHRRIGIIGRSTSDDYFRAKVAAFAEAAPSFQVEVRERDYYEMSPPEVMSDQVEDQALQKFLEDRPDLTGLLVLAATGIRPIMSLRNGSFAARMNRLSLILNVLDGVEVPTMPNGESLAAIYPPLEKLGEELVHQLSLLISGASAAALPRLVPVFREGDSLKMV